MTSTPAAILPIRRPLFGRRRVMGWLYQGLLVAALAALAFVAVGNLQDNLAARGLKLGFDFLWREAGFEIAFHLIPYTASDNYWRVFLIGITNTLLVTVLAILFSTVLGFGVGIAQLSGNWAMSRAARIYVEIVRNLPQLLHILILYNVALRALPAPRAAVNLGDAVYLSNRGILVPALTTDRPGLLAIAILVAVIAALALFRSLTGYAERSGRGVNAWLPSLAVLLLVPGLAVGLSGAQLGVSLPQLKGFNFAGGWVLVPELSALVIAMAIYNAAFIGELVRASIESVNTGQREAAAAIGFGWWQTLRFVVIPQATRVLLPPLSNQYLNILKGSSLAVAIGYPDLVGVFTGISINQTGRAIEIVTMTMAVYLAISLLIGALINLFNHMTRIVER
ncbi:amino-acid transporter subunit; membrane component of ABC superfamily [Bosea sp. 62]|uniref:amino acid ABC transporter permease n=1 Tax=unclassified Bosea (in: a-proteobacteria) TaxID=2653178 RepID=UPI00125846CB|nr:MULTISPECIES: ABC transporter permease subunit [unclassified Bosea (in: a-proteobacteria)]CAD5251426.1 amino-acid transporter subunit; membrane component of ABC superfamily [Bosea sp. 7B]CAD5280587.1 amino-acid transporter subunit; membrane component of ABC superfamily [Bosea sp. 21B]CAD5281711.1 amino-acid transporter subunit; membrane component of ABC superfamily [Bosea sp. 46]VVT59414.1 amino-acid transporter subunit; membrane component of ABC superfamily [Bosea sp. EC-HK365B]VXB28094.1 